jgi:hypothetical protein
VDAAGQAGARGTLGTDLAAEIDLTARPTSVDLHDPAQREQAERALSAIPGVLGARLVPGFDRQIDELHVLTGLGRAPKQTVRDVQTLLMARFGVSTDHRVVSVVQLDESTGLHATARVAIARVSLTSSGPTISAEVVLRDGDRELRGVSVGAGTRDGRARAVAAATLDALSELLGSDLVLELDGSDIVTVGPLEVAVVAVAITTPRATTQVSGSAVVRDAAPEAVVRAVLDGLNRTIANAER